MALSEQAALRPNGANGISKPTSAAEPTAPGRTDLNGTTATPRKVTMAADLHQKPATPSSLSSEEDYDDLHMQVPVMLRRRSSLGLPRGDGGVENEAAGAHNGTADPDDETPEFVPLGKNEDLHDISSYEDLPQVAKTTSAGRRKKTYVVVSEDNELMEILRRGMDREKDTKTSKPRGQFQDMVFTRQFSAFDRQNVEAANSPFHGFYVLFWLTVVIMILKIGADNWRTTGSPLGTNEIMQTMFRREVIVLLLSDGIMCGITGFGWIFQKLVFAGYFDWSRSGWIIQNLWQTAFIGGVVGWTLVRDWPWTHTVFFVLHGIAMLMKQHSYAFYNGYLSTIYKKRQHLLQQLKKLDDMTPSVEPSDTSPPPRDLEISHLAHPPSAAEYKERRMSMSVAPHSVSDIEKITNAISSGKPLDLHQVQLFERLIKWEIDALTDELRGKATNPSHYYPNNLTFTNHYEYIVLPTVVYELEYPRSEGINWMYVAEKVAATFGVIFVMIMISQAWIYPVVMRTVMMKQEGWTLAERFREFPWMLSDLIFPFMMEYLLAWYVIWETVLNILAEVTYFADRSFYDAWWNSVSWDQFARDWNRPVHNFLLRHVYHSSISSMRVNKHTATLITFFLSACVHELIMWCIFKKLRGYLLFLQMFQLPLVQLSRTRWLRNQKTIGNIMFWCGIFTGPSLLCSLYLIL